MLYNVVRPQPYTNTLHEFLMGSYVVTTRCTEDNKCHKRDVLDFTERNEFSMHENTGSTANRVSPTRKANVRARQFLSCSSSFSKFTSLINASWLKKTSGTGVINAKDTYFSRRHNDSYRFFGVLYVYGKGEECRKISANDVTTANVQMCKLQKCSILRRRIFRAKA